MTKGIKGLIGKIEELGWSVEEEGEKEYRLGKFSPAGQDFSIVIKGESVKDLIDDIYEAYIDFDVSRETYKWLDNTGHGTNGAPYHMKEVLEDMEMCEKYIIYLYTALNKDLIDGIDFIDVYSRLHNNLKDDIYEGHTNFGVSEENYKRLDNTVLENNRAPYYLKDVFERCIRRLGNVRKNIFD